MRPSYRDLSLLLMGALLGTLLGQAAMAGPDPTTEMESLQRMRPGRPTNHQSQATGAVSARITLNANALYSVDCSQDAYAELGTSTVTAAAGEWNLWAGVTKHIQTDGTNRYLAVIQRTAAGTCDVAELK